MGIPLNEIKRAMAEAKKPSARMAADDNILNKLDILLDEVRETEDQSNLIENLVQEARIYLPKRRAEIDALTPGNGYSELFDKQGPIKAAIEGEAYLNKIGRLKGDVPMPILNKDGSRTHTQYRTDGITGQELVAPYMDPSDRRIILKTGYGSEFADQGHNSEPSMMNALKLMGYDTQWNDVGTIKGLADLAATKDGATKKVDVMIRGTDQAAVPVPLYTSLIPVKDNGRPEYGRNNERTGAARYVEELVKERIARDNTNVFDAVESLVRDRVVGPFENDKRAGKLLRADSTFVSSPEKVYQSLIMPGYSKEQMRLYGADAPSRKPTAPSSIHMLDLGQALKSLQSGVVDSRNAKYNANYGDPRSNSKYERLQIKPNLPMEAEVGITDVTKTHPLTQQLLDERVMNSRLM